MTELDELNATSFRIIAAVGNARSLYMEAVQAAKAGDYARAEKLLDEGASSFSDGHHAHTALIQREAAGEPAQMNLMLTHAEDQLMGAEQFGIISQELIEIYRTLDTQAQLIKALLNKEVEG